MDAPPAELYRRDPVAFLLYVDLHEKPRGQVTLGDVRRITDAAEKQARAAIRELVKLGALSRAGQDAYGPANASEPDIEPVPAPMTAPSIAFGEEVEAREVSAELEDAQRGGCLVWLRRGAEGYAGRGIGEVLQVVVVRSPGEHL